MVAAVEGEGKTVKKSRKASATHARGADEITNNDLGIAKSVNGTRSGKRKADEEDGDEENISETETSSNKKGRRKKRRQQKQ